MRIAITGATGFLGSAICTELMRRGHQPLALSRNTASAARRLPGVEVMTNDQAYANWPAVDAVIHLAGETVEGRWTPAKKAAIYGSRTDGTRALVDAMRAAPVKPQVLLSASGVGYYSDRGEEVLTEESRPGKDFLASVCIGWESEAIKAAEFGTRVAVFRTAMVLGPGGGPLPALLRPFKLGLGGPMGNGRQWFPWITLDDTVGLYMHALEHPLSGAYIANAPNLVRQAEFARTLAHAIHRPAIFPAPAFALRLVLGEFSVELLNSRRAVPERTLASGYTFQHPELGPALAAMLQ